MPRLRYGAYAVDTNYTSTIKENARRHRLVVKGVVCSPEALPLNKTWTYPQVFSGLGYWREVRSYAALPCADNHSSAARRLSRSAFKV
jgi:hypothetical protein